MRKGICIFTAVLLIVAFAFCGCSDQNFNEATADETMAETTATAFEDTTDVTSSESTDESSTAVTVPEASTQGAVSDTKPAENVSATVNKADTSDMDFDFEEEDIAPENSPVATQAATQGDESAEPEKPSEHKNVTEITTGGTYVLKGEITDKTITVDAGDDDVTIVLEGAEIRNSKGPAVYVRSADKLIITLAEGTSNLVSDGLSYSVKDGTTSVDGAIFSKADLTINGYGSLTVNGNCKHGVVSKDDLVISSGNVTVNANNVGLTGKDCVKINSGNITVNAGTDGVKADNASSASKGFVYFYGGTLNIVSGNDAVQAETVINIENVDLSITAGGGGNTKKPSSSEESYKGLKAGSDIYITGGSFELSTLDDSIHSNGTVTIGGGSYSLISGDDGVHADSDMLISGGDFNIKTLSKGIDVNGNLSVTGGEIAVSSNNKAILDYEISAQISGGSFMGTGSADKSKNFSICNQPVIAVNTGTLPKGTSIRLEDSKGNVVCSFTSQQEFSAVIISNSSLKSGSSYKLTAGSFTKDITA